VDWLKAVEEGELNIEVFDGRGADASLEIFESAWETLIKYVYLEVLEPDHISIVEFLRSCDSFIVEILGIGHEIAIQ